MIPISMDLWERGIHAVLVGGRGGGEGFQGGYSFQGRAGRGQRLDLKVPQYCSVWEDLSVLYWR